MAIKRALCDYDGEMEELRSGDNLAGATAEFKISRTNDNAGAIVIGRPVYVKANSNVDLAQADAAGTKNVLGLVADASIAAAASGQIQTDGVLVATTGEWDTVTGQTGGLTPGALYILSPTTAGGLVVSTTTVAAGSFVAPVGSALSSTELKIDIDPTRKKN